MMYLITQFDMDDVEANHLQQQGSQLEQKLSEEGCRLLMHSEQFEFSVYSMPDQLAAGIKTICQAFAKYSAEVLHVDFQFDLFTWEEIEASGHFPQEFIEAIRQSQGMQNIN